MSASLRLCESIALAVQHNGGSAGVFLVPVVCACAELAVRYTTTRIVGDLKDTLGRSVKKNLRECVYNRIVRLGVRSTDDMSMAGLTQIALEGVEQLDLYYSSHLPQFFYTMLAPLLLFAITVGISWRVALVLLCCAPLIPLSIDKILL